MISDLNKKKDSKVWVIGIILLFGIISWFGIRHFLIHSNVPFLLNENGAFWIQPAGPTRLKARAPDFRIAWFHTNVSVKKIPKRTILSIKTPRTVSVYLEDQLIVPIKKGQRSGVNLFETDLSPYISSGDHDLYFAVESYNGPPILLAYCESINLFSSNDWRISHDRKQWFATQNASYHYLSEIDNKIPTTIQVLLNNWVLFSTIFVIFTTLFYISMRFKLLLIKPRTIRWFIIIAWVALSVNNIFKLPLYMGFDVQAHLDYVFYVLENKSIPFATDGWQMFQSPLYYIISAFYFKILLAIFESDVALLMLRVIPLLCGIAQVQLSYLIICKVYPQREDLQILGTMLGGLMPMNLYISQFVGNEPMSAVLSSATLALIFILLDLKISEISSRNWLILGTLLGLALLTKVSAVLLFPSIIIMIFCRNYKEENKWILSFKHLLLTFSIVLVICGWYYIRNWVVLGRPFMGGWDVARGIEWWQDPGYRTPGHFIYFGKALIQPIFAGIYGVWDALYSTLWSDGFMSSLIMINDKTKLPPWNFDYLLSTTILSLLPMGAILIGFIKALMGKCGDATVVVRLAAISLLIYLGAILYLYATIPIYSTAKATYTLGLIPCYVILFAAGINSLMKSKFRVIIYGFMTCWAVSSYMGFFIL